MHLSRSDVCAIIVAYQPALDLPERVCRVLEQLNTVLIVDNGSAAELQPMLRDIARDPCVTLIANPSNLGVAAALNIGVRRANSLGFRGVLLLDQDTWVESALVDTLLAVHGAFREPDRVAVVGAGFLEIDEQPPDENDPRLSEHTAAEVPTVITSGSLVLLDAQRAIGPFREDFFIDYVDSEYCARARARGFVILKTTRALMLHSVGAPTVHRWLWMTKWTTNHSADRRYYMARNGTVLLREFGNYAYGLWALKSFGRCFRLCKRILLYENSKLAKIAAVSSGWWDALHGRMGPRRPAPRDGGVQSGTERIV